MKNAETVMQMITETSPFMMGFVVITKENNAVVIDGGREADVPSLLAAVGDRPIKAWFLTHAHNDHIDGIIHILQNMPEVAARIEAIYYNMPTVAFITKYEFYERQTRLNLCYCEQKYPEKFKVCHIYQHIAVDELDFEILMTYNPALTSNAVNDSSMVFRMKTENTSVMFLGDIGPEAGDELLRLQYGNLHADYCQMAHHGHMCCGPDVYIEIAPRACFWCAPEWLYNEADYYIRERMFGEGATRKWMKALGVTRHYVTKDGTQTVTL